MSPMYCRPISVVACWYIPSCVAITWWRSTVGTSVWPAPWHAVDGWLPRGKPFAVCHPTWPTQPFILLGRKWVVSWTHAFATRTCVVAPPEECLRVKTDMVLFAGNTVWSISERVADVHKDALYKSTLPLPLPLPFSRTIQCCCVPCEGGRRSGKY